MTSSLPGRHFIPNIIIRGIFSFSEKNVATTSNDQECTKKKSKFHHQRTRYIYKIILSYSSVSVTPLTLCTVVLSCHLGNKIITSLLSVTLNMMEKLNQPCCISASHIWMSLNYSTITRWAASLNLLITRSESLIVGKPNAGPGDIKCCVNRIMRLWAA